MPFLDPNQPLLGPAQTFGVGEPPAPLGVYLPAPAPWRLSCGVQLGDIRAPRVPGTSRPHPIPTAPSPPPHYGAVFGVLGPPRHSLPPAPMGARLRVPSAHCSPPSFAPTRASVSLCGLMPRVGGDFFFWGGGHRAAVPVPGWHGRGAGLPSKQVKGEPGSSPSRGRKIFIGWGPQPDGGPGGHPQNNPTALRTHRGGHPQTPFLGPAPAPGVDLPRSGARGNAETLQ